MHGLSAEKYSDSGYDDRTAQTANMTDIFSETTKEKPKEEGISDKLSTIYERIKTADLENKK